ncbi:OsmC family peroxiredoxin [Ramlibacter terrae]|uniref:OsmC family peroxiredoxin n=1 Tax=Ramlibacter terrae TaxID=2732511 RepID=A0ABX6P398_9BURK|nr:OsmC family peroxiredoxin [Ramlibacter terrae]
MALHACNVEWQRGDQPFTDNRYSRAHRWRFDGGAVVAASSSPHSVRVPFSDPAAVDPEEALLAAVSSCHMLWFLSLAAQAGLVVDRYEDAAEAVLGDIGGGRHAITRVTLRPRLTFSGAQLPDDVQVEALHHAAHERCDIANSIRAEVRVEGSWQPAA